MAGTKKEIRERLEIKEMRLMQYLEAESAVLSGQSYEIENLRLTRADLKKITDMISKLELEIERLKNDLLLTHERRTRFKVIVPGGYARRC